MAKEKNSAEDSKLSKLLDSLQEKYDTPLMNLSDTKTTLSRYYLDSPEINYAFGGSWVDGRIWHFWGPESSGKTLLSMRIASMIQKRETKNGIIFVDFEHTFDKEFYARVLPDFDWSRNKFVYIDPLDGETAFDIIRELIKSGHFGLIIWDSVATTPSKAIMSKEIGGANFGKTASLMSEALKAINPYVNRFKTSMIFINQVRASMDMYKPESTPSSRALNFYSSGIFRISKAEEIKAGKETVGIIIKAKNKKNKVGLPFREALLPFYFVQGFDPVSEYVDYILKLNVSGWSISGSWISNESKGIKMQGKEKFTEYLKQNEEEFWVLKNTVNSSLTNRLSDDKDEDDPDKDFAFMEEEGES